MRLHEDAKIPRRAHDSDCGFDLYAQMDSHMFVGCSTKIPTGIACELPEGYAGFIWPRSGLASKYQLDVLGGLVDQGYRGEIFVTLFNHGERPVHLKKGDRIAQMVVGPFVSTAIEVKNLSDSDRGEGGHGSTGK